MFVSLYSSVSFPRLIFPLFLYPLHVVLFVLPLFDTASETFPFLFPQHFRLALLTSTTRVSSFIIFFEHDAIFSAEPSHLYAAFCSIKQFPAPPTLESFPEKIVSHLLLLPFIYECMFTGPRIAKLINIVLSFPAEDPRAFHFNLQHSKSSSISPFHPSVLRFSLFFSLRVSLWSYIDQLSSSPLSVHPVARLSPLPIISPFLSTPRISQVAVPLPSPLTPSSALSESARSSFRPSDFLLGCLSPIQPRSPRVLSTEASNAV